VNGASQSGLSGLKSRAARRRAPRSASQLWNEMIREQSLAVFCAYPRIGATRDLTESLADVCAAHSKVCMG